MQIPRVSPVIKDSAERSDSKRYIAAMAFVLLGGLFGWYLYHNTYPDHYYDAREYWELANKYWSTGRFNFQSFDSISRGYLFPLLLSPLTLLTAYLGWEPINITRAVGLVMAALLFGVVAPGVWRAIQTPGSPPVSLIRRIAFGLFGFVLWRDYFNFPLTDFPAFLALLAGLWAVLRTRSVGGGLLAGVAVAMAVNFRPVYAATLPLAALLCFLPHAATTRRQIPQAVAWGRRAAFVAGVCLVLYPQLILNRVHFGVSSPLVLTAMPDQPSLYLSQLQGGLYTQKYETNVGTDYPRPQMFFRDSEGKTLANTPEFLQANSYAAYLKATVYHPAAWFSLLLRHAFNGLDLQYPTPYPQEVYVSTWPLALLNYTILLLGLGTLAAMSVRRLTLGSIPLVVVLLTILGPCAASVPVVMECRFLMPLHLLLGATFAFGFRPRRVWQALTPAKGALGMCLFALLIAGCFALSINTHQQLEIRPRRLFDWQAPIAEPW